MRLLSWLVPRRRRGIDLDPGAVVQAAESSIGPATTVRSEHLREYWQARAALAAYAYQRLDLDRYPERATRLEEIAAEAETRAAECVTGVTSLAGRRRKRFPA